MLLSRSVLVTAVLLGMAATDSSALDTVGRDQGWTLGLGFGMGRAEVSYLGGVVEEDFREGVSTEWRLGKMLNRKLALTFDYQGWLIEDGNLGVRLRQGLQSWGLGLTWYPGNPENAWGGMFVRVGGGWALANLAATTLDEDLHEVEEERIDEWGVAASGTIGYEFFVTNTVAMGPTLNFAYLWIDEELADEGRWLTFSLLGSWYF
jgi:hypothetical protein